MDYSIDFLYDYNNERGMIDRYLVSFINDDDKLRSVEIEIINNDLIEIVEEESDELSKDDRMLLYYILDRWAINHLI
jgi:hypothetical protein